MKYRLASLLLGGSLLAATGCIHPTFGEFNNNTSLIPPLGKFTGKNNIPPAAMLAHSGPGVGGPGPGVMMTSAAMMAGTSGGDGGIQTVGYNARVDPVDLAVPAWALVAWLATVAWEEWAWA